MVHKRGNVFTDRKISGKKFLNQIIIGAFLTCLVGCSNNLPTEQDYVKDTSAGKQTEVPLAQIVERQNNGEKMLVLFKQDGCSYCTAFDEVVDAYIKNHNIELNVVNLTKEEVYNSKEDIKNVLNVVVGGVDQTPALYYIESKEDVYLLDYSDGDYTSESLSAFIEKYQLDRVKETPPEDKQAKNN